MVYAKKVCRSGHELLFRNIFQTQIHIQTQIRKIFALSLATNHFPNQPIFIKLSQKVANKQFIDKKGSL